jgi:membrane protein
MMGAIYVTVAVVMFFKNYDYIVNDIFDTPPRTLWKALKRYLFLLIIIPIMLGTSFWLSAFLQSYLDKTALTSLIHLYSLLPYLIAWATFYLLYQLSAKTPIDVSAAVISSFITSLVWYGSKSTFIFYVLHNKTYASIYGNISILLFIYLWISISWAIFIHGLKFCNLLNKDEEIEKI